MECGYGSLLSLRDGLLGWMDLRSDSLWPLLAFMLEDSVFLNKMTAVQWLVFHSSFLAKSGNPYLGPFPLNLAARPGSSVCAWSHEQQNTYSIYSPDSAFKDLGLCQQGTKPHFEMFSVVAKGACAPKCRVHVPS